MNVFKYILLLLISSVCGAQVAFQNYGNIQMHQDTEIGFHVDLVNHGTFNQNLGLAVFYNQIYSLSISGSEVPRFFDVDVEVPNNLYLNISTEIINSLGYIAGDVITPRNTPSIALEYIENAIFVLEHHTKHVDGYVSFEGTTEFKFPIGSGEKLRSLITTNSTPNTTIKGAYFDENPNFPSTFPIIFDTNLSESILNYISEIEFWDFDGPDNSLITLTWDAESEIDNLVSDLNNLRVVGWHIADQQWKDLGNSNTTGTLSEGTISSIVFNPSDYEVITFGSFTTTDDFTVYNLFSPNDDGTNDTFVISGITTVNNELKIFNRWGKIVFQATNYQNDWNGISDVGNVFSKGEKLPVGTYFYTLEIKDFNKTSAGYLYINY